MNTLEDISKLKEGWDGYDAKPISKNILNNAYMLKKYSYYEPEIFPSAANMIQFEWTCNDKDLECEIYADKYTLFYPETNKTIEFDITELYKVINLIKLFHKPIKKGVLFTGAFNPPTIAHNYMIQTALNDIKSDYVLFAISNEKFLAKKQKRNKDWYFSEKERLQMILEMTWNNPNVLLYGIEQGYTYEVLCAVKNEFDVNELFFACGSDKLKEIPRWGFHDKLMKEFGFYILKRNEENFSVLDKKCKDLFTNYVLSSNNPYSNISATQVRNKIKNKENYKELLHENVYNYISNHNILER